MRLIQITQAKKTKSEFMTVFDQFRNNHARHKSLLFLQFAYLFLLKVHALKLDLT